MPLIPEPSTTEAIAVGAAAATFPTALVANKFYQVLSTTACWISRARAVAFSAATFTADAGTDKLTFGAAHGLTSGDGPFQFTNSGVTGALPTGLLLTTDYWVIGDTVNTFKLATSFDNAQAGTAINLTTNGTGTNTLADTVDTLDVTPLVVADATVTVNAGSDLFTLAAHGLLTGDGPVQFSNSGGALPAGLTSLTDYWIWKFTANQFKVATSYANAIANTIVDVTDAGTGTHTISDTANTVRRATLIYNDATFTASAATDKITIAAHGLSTGDGPFQLSTANDALPGGISALTDYWAIVTDADKIKIATTYALALVPTPVNITDAGLGTQTMSDTTRTIAAGTGAVAGAGSGSMPLGAGIPVTIAGVVTVSGSVRSKLSIIRNAADGAAGVTLCAWV